MWAQHVQMGVRNTERKKKKRHVSSFYRDQQVNTTGSAPKVKVLKGHGSETQKCHWAVVCMDNTGVHGKGEARLCQIQDMVWDWPSLWDGLSGTSEDQLFVPFLFHTIRVQHQLQKIYLQKCKKSEITNCSRRKTVTYVMGYCHCLSCSEYHKDPIAWKPGMERRKQRRRQGKKKKT